MRRARILAVVAASVMVAACSPSEVPDADDGGTGDGGSVRFLIAENFWADWVPYQSTAQSQQRLNVHLYDTLLEFPTGDLAEPEPMLATEWEQVDETTWEFNLRDDVTFHDGSDFTAEDVKASVEWASGATDQSSVLADRWVPTTVEVVDDYTARLVTEEPLASMFDAIRLTPVVSSEDVEGGEETLAEAPNGTGPFELENETETRKSMVANPDYWSEPAAVQTLVWEFVGDAQTRVNALRSGQAEAIDRVPADQHATIEDADGLVLESMTAAEQVNLWTVPGRVQLWDESPEFRRAITLAIDRESLATNLVQGNSVVAQSFMPSESLYYVEGDPSYEQDVEEARRLVREVGAEGQELEVWAASGFLPGGVRVAQAIVQNLNAIGLNAELVTTDVAGLVDDANAGNGGSGLLYHISWASGGAPAAAVGIYGMPPWTDEDPRVAELIASGKTTTDSEEREQVYADLQAYMWENLPHVPLYYSDFSVAHTDRLEGARILPNFETNFYPASISE
jgi:peptide/nickel transport system substrate-binding protein